MIAIVPAEWNTPGHSLWSIGAGADEDTTAVIDTGVNMDDAERLIVILRPIRALAYLSQWHLAVREQLPNGNLGLSFQKSALPGSGLDTDTGPIAQVEVETFLVAT